MIHTKGDLIRTVTHKYALELCFTCGSKLQEPLIQTDDHVMFCTNPNCDTIVTKAHQDRAYSELDSIKFWNDFVTDNFELDEDKRYGRRYLGGGWEMYTYSHSKYHLTLYDIIIGTYNAHVAKKIIDAHNSCKDMEV